jgi:hypothetical protein
MTNYSAIRCKSQLRNVYELYVVTKPWMYRNGYKSKRITGKVDCKLPCARSIKVATIHLLSVMVRVV